MNDELVQLTNQAVLAVLLGCGGSGLVFIVGLVIWLQRQTKPEEGAKRPPPVMSVVFTRRERSDDEDTQA
ncbi:MAG: hypothetical protein AAGA48_07335 [Myxococcota bacterium]